MMPRIFERPRYEVLPTNGSASLQSSKVGRPQSRLRSIIAGGGRPMKRLLLAFVLLAIIGFWTKDFVIDYYIFRKYHGLPTYKEVQNFENNLPQHNLNLPYPEGRDGRYVFFAIPYHGIGFNNQFQDIIMHSQMAYMSNRAYAFQPYLWDVYSEKSVVLDDGRYRSARIPLNAFISGPMAGGAFSEQANGVKSPRSVSWAFFEKVCPPERRVQVNVKEVRKEMKMELSDNPPAKDTLSKWGKKLRSLNDTCIEVMGDHVWTFEHFGSLDLVSAWDHLKDSPMLTRFEWSPLVQRIVLRSWHHLTGSQHIPEQAPEVIPGLLALHLRRGDFIPHCDNLRDWRANFVGWTKFPEYVDKFDPYAEDRDENYQRHCLPSVTGVLEKVRAVKRDWEGKQSNGSRRLSRVYILTNAEPAFLDELKQGLFAEGWESIATTFDVVIEPSEVEISMVADMMIAQISEVFIGNGFSSFTANVDLIRRAKGASPDSIRFW